MLRKIEAVIKKAVGGKVQVFVTTSEKPEFGDYSTNIAFSLAKEKSFRQAKGKKFPAEIAGDLVKKIQNSDKKRFFEKVESTGGFVNLWVSKKVLIGELGSLLKTKSYNPKAKRLKINLEFISANPTGPLTMANGRGGFLGDTLAKILEVAGHKVTREYYINDAGNQIRLLGDSILAVLGKVLERDEHYQGAYIKDLADVLKSKILSSTGEKKLDSEAIGRLAAAELLKQIKISLKNSGIEFNNWFSEYENLHKKDELKKVLALLEKKGLVEKKEGAVWLKQFVIGGLFARPDSKKESGLGLKTSDIADPDATVGAGEKDRVLVKSDGKPTYFLSDLAYHYDKFVKRKFDLAVDIWGADHHGYVARLQSGVKALGIDSDRLKIIITQLVRLIEDGKEVRMSKRKGDFITLDELIEELGGKPSSAKASAGRDAARFFFLMHTPDSHMDFDLALAKERSLKNPVYYVQYAYVRAFNILKRADAESKISDLKSLSKESELALIKELVKFPDMVLQIAEDYQVSRLARYAMSVARAFNNFYEKERVIGENGEVLPERLALVTVFKDIFARVFALLGIDAPEKM